MLSHLFYSPNNKYYMCIVHKGLNINLNDFHFPLYYLYHLTVSTVFLFNSQIKSATVNIEIKGLGLWVSDTKVPSSELSIL